MNQQSNTMPAAAQCWVVMGVCGCGKSEVGRRLAAKLALTYIEGDDYHPASNIAKMAAGTPLEDADRHEWLLLLQSFLQRARESGKGLVLSCSALKRKYRDVLRAGDPDLLFVHLEGQRELIAARLQARAGHFMPPTLLDSQLRDLEPLAPDEYAIRVDIDAAPEQLIDQVLQQFAAAHADHLKQE